MIGALHSIEHMLPQNEALVNQYSKSKHLANSANLMCMLTWAIQKHRGATMGSLSGQPAFDELASNLSQKIDRLLTLLESETKCCSSEEQEQQLQTVYHEWKIIQLGWRDDDLMQNFEFHGHVIEQLMRLMALCRKQLREANENSFEKIGFTDPLTTYLRVIPRTTETLARLRGLCTNVAVLKACGTENHRKISYLLEQAKQEHQEIMKLNKDPYLEFSLRRSYRSEFRVFSTGIRDSIIKSKAIVVDSSKTFDSATSIIDQLWLLADKGLRCYDQKFLDLLLSSES